VSPTAHEVGAAAAKAGPAARPAAYFDGQLNYSLGDEDTSVELAALPEGARHVVAIAGSGGRALPLLARRPAKLTCVDVSGPQLALTEMRFAALRALDRDEYVSFLGYPPRPMGPAERERCFRRLELSERARGTLERIFMASGWAPIAYLGRFERAMGQLAKVNGVVTGAAGRRLFEAADLEAQRAYLASSFPQARFRAVLLLLGNAAVLNSLLYKGEFPKKNLPESAYSVYRGVFDRLFTRALARESYFLQLVFFGRLEHAEGNPVECDPATYEQARRALGETEVSFVSGDVVDLVRRAEVPVDFLSLSDVPTFFQGPLETSFLRQLRPGLGPGALVVTRGHMRVMSPDLGGYEVVTSAYREAIERESTQLWKIQIYRAS
jgi:S-adenosylmethionine:diacylglycerol 3-amino-3-carboxypropyl transferase